MPWFRWRRNKDTQNQAAQPVAAVSEAPAPARPAEPEDNANVETAAESAESAEATRKRRRGSRGGRGRKKPGAPTAEVTVRAEPERKPTQKKEAAERRSSRAAGARRRQPPRRASLPAAKRELLISVDVGEQRVAVLEDDKVAEVYLERPERRSIAGNIYLGVVDNVLPGMEAAFVEIGLEKNGFLYVDEIVVPELEGKRHGKKIQDLIQRGQQILVQAVKDPMKTKGARLTTEISLPGRFLVYVPNGEGLGVSRRLEDAERSRLKEIIKDLRVKEGGIIVRTAAEGASADDVERDLVFLQRLWKTIQAHANTAKPPALVYQEAELPLRIVRDLFAGDFIAAHVDNDRAHKRIVGYLKKTSPHMLERVHRYKDTTPLFAAHGVDREIESTLSRRVDLPSGGYLVFDYAEAFTVIDVNTGRFVGSRSKTSTARLEDTITKNNLEAVKEVVRQLRLRDIGGIIVIDFIDMANPKNRAQVEEALRAELERDRTKTYVVEISPLGLVEMTRQNVTDGPREILTRKCPVCEGDGIIVSDATVAMQVERRLRAVAAAGTRVQAYRVAVHPRILELVAGPGGARLAAIEEAVRRRFFLVPAEASGHVHTDHFEVLAEGKLTDLQPQAPVEEGAEVELKLVEVGLHDAAAGVGKVDGYDVVVAGAAKLVGKKAKVKLGRVLDRAAYAAFLEAETGESPITFESEAEKPTRAPARRKESPEPQALLEKAAAAEVEPEEAAPAEAVAEEAVAEEGAADDAEATPKRKTRRGSRGGRRHKKPTAAAAGAGAGAEAPVEEPVAEAAPVEAESPARPEAALPAAKPKPKRRRTPKIHVPPPEPEPEPEQEVEHEVVAEAIAEAEESVNGDLSSAEEAAAADAEPKPKKKTRRGSRGGRRRRKPTTATNVAGEADTEAVATEAGSGPTPGEREPAALEAADAGYVPMSDWLDDFSR